MIRVLACALTAWSVLWATPAAADQPPDLQQYSREVHQLRIALDEQARSPSPTILDSIRARLGALREVRLPNGRILQTGNRLLASEISSLSPAGVADDAHAVDRLDANLKTARRAGERQFDLASLEAVYQDRRFHPSRSWIERFADWVATQFANLLNPILAGIPNVAAPDPVFDVLSGGIFLLVVAVITFLIARQSLAREAIEATIESEAGDPVTAKDAGARAERCAVEGDYRLALRYLFLQLMLELQRLGALELSAGLTNREYLQHLRETAPDAGALRLLVDEFDRVWYGHGDLDGHGYDRCKTLARRALDATDVRESA